MPVRLLGLKPMLIGGATLMLAGATAFGVQTWRLHSAKTEIAQLQSSQFVCTLNTKALKAQIENQNKRVREMSRVTEEIDKSAARRAEDVLNKPLLPPTSPGAEGLNRWLESLSH